MKNKNTKNIRVQIAELQNMSVSELKTRWQQVTETDAPECGRIFLRRQLAYKIQELHYGGLNSETQQQLVVIASTPKLKPNASGILPGTRFERDWKNKRYVVIARTEGFELDGQMFQSLSGIAKTITGTSWNGNKFFGAERRPRNTGRNSKQS